MEFQRDVDGVAQFLANEPQRLDANPDLSGAMYWPPVWRATPSQGQIFIKPRPLSSSSRARRIGSVMKSMRS